MADMNDRGQLILVTGFAIAVAIVALVLLLNTAIYAENLATRNVDAGADEALTYRSTVEDSLWPVIEAENEEEYADRSTFTGNVTDRIDRFTELTAQRHLDGGASANVSNRTIHDGTWLRQTNDSRQVTDASGTANWTMATGADGVRAFDVNTTGGLESTSDPGNEAFRVTLVGDGGNEWSVYVYNDPLLSGDTLAVKNGTGTVTEDVCTGLFSTAPQVNLTAGTVGGSDCDALVFAKGVSPPYDVEVTHGNRAEASYNATVNTTNVGNFNQPSTSPYEAPVVYRLSVDVVYETAELEYRARVHLEPEGS